MNAKSGTKPEDFWNRKEKEPNGIYQKHDDVQRRDRMFTFLFGLAIGAGGVYVATRFRDGIKIAKDRLEKKVDDALKGNEK